MFSDFRGGYNNKHQFINTCIKYSKNRNSPSMEVTSKPKLVTPTFNLFSAEFFGRFCKNKGF